MIQGMKLQLSPELEDLVREKVSSGLYRDASDVVAEALRLLDRFDQQPALRRDALRAAVQQGLDSAEAGKVTVIETDQDLKVFFNAL
jgi:antitoxin ParD1/3/4